MNTVEKLKFKQDLRSFFTSKSNWAGMSMIATGVIGYQWGDMDPVTASQSIFGGVGLLFIKDAIAGA